MKIYEQMNDLYNKLRLDKDVCVHPYPVEFIRSFFAIIGVTKPKRIIEFGPRNGYTTIMMAGAAKYFSSDCKIVSYDTWENQTKGELGSTPRIEQTAQNLKRYEVDDIIDLKECNFWEWIKEPEEFDLLYVDIENDGEKINCLYDAVKDRIEEGAIVLFEGGSIERDNVAWMKEQSKTTFNSIKDRVGYKTLCDGKYSLSVIKK